ncbi:MAG: HD domain-containing protein, partial [Deltaproteobacteria bacterium]
LSDLLSQLLFRVQEDKDTYQFLRFAALYHDIGKVFHRDRHAILGRHIIESPPDPNGDEELRKFHEILGHSDERFAEMIRLIGHHDLYGVLCTGEASRPVLIDVAGFKPDRHAWSALGNLFVLNIADIYGTLPDFVPEKLRLMAEDWSFVSGLLPSSGDAFVYRKKFEDRIYADSQHPAYAAERIWRLLTAATLLLPVRSPEEEGLFDDEAEKQRFVEKVTPGMVRDALRAELGPGLASFCNDFSLVCKFDYTLRFIVRLSHAWVSRQLDRAAERPDKGRRKTPKVRQTGKRKADQLLPSELAAIVVELFVRLVNNYRDLTVHKRGWPQRIGIELMGLTRSREIEQRVIDLLLSPRRAEGINWAADEATAWYFV